MQKTARQIIRENPFFLRALARDVDPVVMWSPDFGYMLVCDNPVGVVMRTGLWLSFDRLKSLTSRRLSVTMLKAYLNTLEVFKDEGVKLLD